MKERCDILVIGGGINGASIARAAAVAGHDVVLVEQGDLAQATSSASTKLIHGGLRYLERFEFMLVRESLRERAIMLRTAPHIVRPLQFRLPHDPAIRPWPVVRAGLLLYDLMAAGGGLPRSRAIRLEANGIRSSGRPGFSYWDGWVDDARLVILNALDAAEAGATISTQTRFLAAQPTGQGWRAKLMLPGGTAASIDAATIVNAAGPWVAQLLERGFDRTDAAQVRLVRGSHIVIRHAVPDSPAYLLQQGDGRIVFAIPYGPGLTLVGTTDMPVDQPEDTDASPGEIAYLLAAANAHFDRQITPDDIVWRYAGVRALHDDGTADPSAVSRDYRLVLDQRGGGKLLSVYGGKLTTARHLAEVALRKLGLRLADTRHRCLPGGNIGSFAAFLADVHRDWPFLGTERGERMARAYGSRLRTMLDGARSAADMGEAFGAGLTAVEADYLMRTEWARTTDDILWRRTKLGLHFSAPQVKRLADHMAGTAR